MIVRFDYLVHAQCTVNVPTRWFSGLCHSEKCFVVGVSVRKKRL